MQNYIFIKIINSFQLITTRNQHRFVAAAGVQVCHFIIHSKFHSVRILSRMLNHHAIFVSGIDQRRIRAVFTEQEVNIVLYSLTMGRTSFFLIWH